MSMRKVPRKGYGYELLETLSGYTGWKFEYVTCDWSNCFEKLINGEFDIMGDISYTEERAKQMLFSDEPMGEEKYYLYADLSDTDISSLQFSDTEWKTDRCAERNPAGSYAHRMGAEI